MGWQGFDPVHPTYPATLKTVNDNAPAACCLDAPHRYTAEKKAFLSLNAFRKVSWPLTRLQVCWVDRKEIRPHCPSGYRD